MERNKGKIRISKNLYTYNGETKSAEEWANDIGISPAAFRDRIKRNWTTEKIFTRKGPKKFEYHGKLRTFRELADIAGIPENTFSLRIRRGWTLERAMATEKHPWDIEYKGEWHSLNTWAKILDIPVGILRQRKAAGWTIERMFETPYTSKERSCGYIRYNYLGYSYRIEEWAKVLNVSPVTIISRLQKQLPFEEIFCTDMRRKHRVGDENYLLKDWAKVLNVNLSEITNRYLNGLTIEEAIVDIRACQK